MTTAGGTIAAFALTFKGAPYVYGGTTPSGWDCSGFVQYVLKHFGIAAPRTSEQQWAWSQHISASQLAPGDLVFAQFPGDNASPGHVGIYVGNGQVLSAEDPAQGTGLDTLSDWGSAIVGYGRPQGATAGGNVSPPSGGGGVIGDIWAGSGIPQFINDADTFVKALMWLAQPSSWVRIGAFIGGVALLLFAIHALIATANGEPLVSSPSVIPVPV